MKILKEVLLIVTSLFTLNSFSQEIDNDLDSTIYLNEIIVNAFQISTLQLHVPGSVSVLTGEEIQITDGNNFAHTLHSIPGIYMHSGTYSTSRVIIRGVGSRTPYNTNRIKSYLNDIPITSSDGISTPEDIDLMGIGRMEVIKGPASATYGSGLGGNIILYTPRSTKEGAAALIQYGSFNTIKAAASGNYINQNLNLWGTISHVNSDGYRENNRYRRTSFISSGEWEQKDYSLEYTLMLIDLNAQIPSSVGKSLYESNPKAAAANWSAIEGYKKYQRAIAGVTLTNLFSDKFRAHPTVNSLFGRLRWQISTQFINIHPYNFIRFGIQCSFDHVFKISNFLNQNSNCFRYFIKCNCFVIHNINGINRLIYVPIKNKPPPLQ